MINFSMEDIADFCFFDSLNKVDAIAGRDEFRSTFILASSILIYEIPFSLIISEFLFFSKLIILGSSIVEVPWESASRSELATSAMV